MQLLDTFDVLNEEGDTRMPSKHFTFWTKTAASRLDRFYVTPQTSVLVYHEEVQVPRCHSDHQAVLLSLRDTRRRRPNTKVHHRFKYPSALGRPDRLKEDAQATPQQCHRRTVRSAEISWETERKLLLRDLTVARKAGKRRARQLAARLQQQRTTLKSTRADYIKERATEVHERLEVGFGVSLLSTQSDTQALFKRISDWSRDQHISRLRRVHCAGPKTASIADIMVDEMMHIIGSDHATVHGSARARLFDRRVCIPTSKRVTANWNRLLMATIIEEETEHAIKRMQRNKASGTDDLSNDFF